MLAVPRNFFWSLWTQAQNPLLPIVFTLKTLQFEWTIQICVICAHYIAYCYFFPRL